jgi:hypothetical protein
MVLPCRTILKIGQGLLIRQKSTHAPILAPMSGRLIASARTTGSPHLRKEQLLRSRRRGLKLSCLTVGPLPPTRIGGQ